MIINFRCRPMRYKKACFNCHYIYPKDSTNGLVCTNEDVGFCVFPWDICDSWMDNGEDLSDIEESFRGIYITERFKRATGEKE